MVDWEHQRVLLQWWAAATVQEARARVLLRNASKLGKRSKVLGRPLVNATDLQIGDDFRIWSAHRRTAISGWGRIRIGDGCFMNTGSMVISVLEITIGDDVALANEVLIVDSHSHGVEGRATVEAPVRIGDGAWLGNRAMVLPGVTIGRRALVAAGAIVTADVPDDTLVAGNPARPIRTLNYPQGCLRAWCDQFCRCPDKARIQAGRPAPNLPPRRR